PGAVPPGRSPASGGRGASVGPSSDRVIPALVEAQLGLRVRRQRSVLTAVGIALAAAMLAAALVVVYGLGTGFTRGAAAAHLAEVIVRFDPQPADRVARRIE